MGNTKMVLIEESRLTKAQISRAANRFWKYVDISSPKDCWNWIGSLNGQGYGQIHVGSTQNGTDTTMKAHRFMWLMLERALPHGITNTIDHLCGNTRCVKPSHLRIITRRENILRGTAPSAEYARRTHCKNGHPLTPENVYYRKDPKHTGRCCKACDHLENKERYWRKKLTPSYGMAPQ